MYRNPALFADTISHALTHDIAMSGRSRRREQAHFERIRRAAIQYAVQLRKIARHVGDLIKQFPPGSEAHISQINELLTKYSNLIEPWANKAAERMISEVSRRDEVAWFRHAKEMSRLMKREVMQTPLGEIMRQLQAEQVHYIKSIPLDAAQRVQELTLKYVLSGKRYDDLIQDILNQTNVSLSKATLIARTETAKAQSIITQARAEYVGSPGYIWRTARDSRVRKAHKKLEGTPQKWNEPPIAEENGDRHHPGQYPNCRCFPGHQLVDLRFGCDGLFRVFYEGKLVHLKIGSEIIEATPNHPLLTEQGWISAEALKHGDKIVCVSEQSNRVEAVNKYSMKTAFSQLFDANLVHPVERRELGFGLNFYGDIFENNVDYIVVDQLLLAYLKAVGFENIGKFPFTSTDTGVERSVISGFSQVAIPSSPRGLDTFMTSTDTSIYPELSEFAAQLVRIATYTESSFTDKSAAFYHFRSVEDKTFCDFSDHVYTLQNRQGIYPVGNIGAIAKNCYAEPIIPD